MGSLLLSFKGRINAADLQRCAIILIVIGTIINIIGYFSTMAGIVLGLLGILLLWPWIALWIKRYHDAGKSGWMCLLPLVVGLTLGFVISLVLNRFVPLDTDAITAATEAAAASGDIMGAMMAGVEGAKPQLLPNAALSALASLLVVFVFNGMIKSDPEENQFGGPTN